MLTLARHRPAAAGGAGEGARLASNEERYVLAESMTPPVYMMPWAYRIEGALDVDRLRRALASMVASHPSLRAEYRRSPAGEWRRHVLPHADIPLPLIDAPGIDLPELRRRFTDAVFAPIDFTPRTLQRHFIVRAAPDRHWFITSLHHAIGDGVSTNLFLRQLFDLYAGDAPLAVQEGEDVRPADWRDRPELPASIDYWRRMLADAGEQADVLAELDCDDPVRIAADVEVAVPPDAFARTRDAAKAMGVSHFALWYAAGLVALSRLQNRGNVLTSFQSANRRGLDGADTMIGCFSSAVPLVQPVDEGASFRALAASLSGRMKEAMRMQAAPLHEIIRATAAHPTVGMNWFPLMPVLDAPGLRISQAYNFGRHSDFSLNFRWLADDRSARMILYYREGLLTRAFAELMAQRVAGLAQAFAAAPDAPIRDVAAQGEAAVEAETPDIAGNFNEPVFAAFLRHAAAHPHRPALRGGIGGDGGRMTYGELDAASAALARALLPHVRPGDAVAVIGERTPALVAALLGVLRAGGAYAVFDSGYPDARWEAMAAVARPAAVLAPADGEAATRGRHFALAQGLPLVTPGETPDAAAPLPTVDPDATAYLLFTSGTTGTPRCIATAHGPLVHFLAWQRERFGIGRDDRLTMLSGLGHDPVQRDVWGALSAGAELLIPEQDTLTAPRGLWSWARAEQPTAMHLTPPLGRLFADGATPASVPSLRLAFWGGDMLRPALTEAVSAVAPGVAHVNFYGATETPQAIASHAVPAPAPSPPPRAYPIGEATPGFALDVIGRTGSPAALGEQGELVVRSRWMSRGYVVDGDVRPHDPPGRYRTGDQAYRDARGQLVLRGRADDQVKVRGHRIELADLAAALEARAEIAQAAALAIGEPERELHAFVVAAPGAALDAGAVQAMVAAARPAHYVPHRVHLLDRLPLLPNGKLDRRALERIAAESADDAEPDANERLTEREAAILQAWGALLNRPLRSPRASFATMGGDSLSFVGAFLALEKIIGQVPEGWQFRPVGELAAAATGKRSWLRAVDTAVVIRGFAVLAIVAFHFGLLNFGGGSTSALFLVSGFLLGAMQLTEAQARGTARPVGRVVARILVPTALLSLLLYASKLADGDAPDLAQHLVTAAFLDYRATPGGGDTPYSIILWYVQAAIIILLLVWTALWAAMRGGRAPDPFRFSAWLFAAGCAGRYLLPAAFVPGWFADGVPALHVVNMLPTTHLPTFALGMMLAHADSPRRRWLLLGLLLGYAALSFQFFDSTAYLFMVAVGVLLMVKPYLKLPSLLAAALFAISANSLFVYLTHGLFGAVAKRASGGLLPEALLVAVAVALGIAVGVAWRRVEGLAIARARSRDAREEAAASV